jgi:hypothetical protein
LLGPFCGPAGFFLDFAEQLLLQKMPWPERIMHGDTLNDLPHFWHNLSIIKYPHAEFYLQLFCSLAPLETPGAIDRRGDYSALQTMSQMLNSDVKLSDDDLFA